MVAVTSGITLGSLCSTGATNAERCAGAGAINEGGNNAKSNGLMSRFHAGNGCADWAAVEASSYEFREQHEDVQIE